MRRLTLPAGPHRSGAYPVAEGSWEVLMNHTMSPSAATCAEEQRGIWIPRIPTQTPGAPTEHSAAKMPTSKVL